MSAQSGRSRSRRSTSSSQGVLSSWSGSGAKRKPRDVWRHPNVVDVTNFGFADTTTGPVAYLVMEHLDGRTLADVLTEEGRLSIGWVVDILEQVCSAVDEAHRLGIIHRDLKPDNIWLEPNLRGGYTVKVLDFGLAKLGHLGPERTLDAQAVVAGFAHVLYAPVVIIERTGILHTLARARRLTWRVRGTVLIITVFQFALPVLVWTAAYDTDLEFVLDDNWRPASFGFNVVTSAGVVVCQLLNVFITPLAAIMTTELYLKARHAGGKVLDQTDRPSSRSTSTRGNEPG